MKIGKETLLASIWITSNLTDVLVTQWGLTQGAQELSPFSLAMITVHNAEWAYIWKMLGAVAVGVLLARISKVYSSALLYLGALNIILGTVVLWNLYIVLN